VRRAVLHFYRVDDTIYLEDKNAGKGKVLDVSEGLVLFRAGVYIVHHCCEYSAKYWAVFVLNNDVIGPRDFSQWNFWVG
jgi:hypothetical protein